MEEIEVTVRFDSQGNIIPLNFVWKGRAYRVDSIGRNWKATDGSHILVMTPGNRAYHLVFKAEVGRWYLLRGGDVPPIPRV